jgi:cysteinyl-tRNA synthetase
MKLYNTYSRKKENLITKKKNEVLFYHCGPTVYWTQHIGNLRGMAMGDLVVRTLEYLGFSVKHVRNYTDVGHLSGDNIGNADIGEDRMIKGAKRENLTPHQIANKYITIFEKDTQALNLKEPTHKPRATEYIKEMQAMIAELLKKGMAYTTDLAVYYDVSKFVDYGKLSGKKIDEEIEGAGVGQVTDSQKKNPADFVLWFFKAGVHKNALQTWNSPFKSMLVKKGEGFPGWHIECSAMTKKLLGKTLDIHMGGVEHISIHHPNEIAQSVAVNQAPLANYWLHNEHLLVDGKKMAKSEGTSYSLAEIVDRGFDPLDLRYLFLQAHYRSIQNFTFNSLSAARTARLNIVQKLQKLKSFTNTNQGIIVNDNEKLFKEALCDDFNTPKALAVMHNLLDTDINAADIIKTVLLFDSVFALNLSEMLNFEVPPGVIKLAKKRQDMRKGNNFKEADLIREEIESMGFIVEDNKDEFYIYPQIPKTK